jgi:hypothetical protein
MRRGNPLIYSAARCGGVALDRTSAAGRAGAADRRIISVERTRSVTGVIHSCISAGASEAWVDGRRQHPNRLSLGRGQHRAYSRLRGRACRPPSGCSLRRRDARFGCAPTGNPFDSLVFTQVADPIGMGFVASLARPGGNITGSIDRNHGIYREPTAKGLKDRIFSPGQGRRGSWKP